MTTILSTNPISINEQRSFATLQVNSPEHDSQYINLIGFSLWTSQNDYVRISLKPRPLQPPLISLRRQAQEDAGEGLQVA